MFISKLAKKHSKKNINKKILCFFVMDLNKEKNVLYYTIGDYMEITNKDIEILNSKFNQLWRSLWGRWKAKRDKKIK